MVRYSPERVQSAAVKRLTTHAVVFVSADWTRSGEYLTMTHTLPAVRGARYLRVRGTNTAELEPAPDPRGENPWDDLWFYTNPIFLEAQ
jgi:hypothetical protein